MTPPTGTPDQTPSDLPAPDLTFSAFQRLIHERYYETDAGRGPAATFLLLTEEFGELATALHRNLPGKTPTEAERTNLEEEFADVLAWLATMANITGVDLARTLEKYTVEGRVEGVKD
ncbi:MAG: MazG nucleotide pyrophosphohydrolase domain-containing protein [Planctomycetota bacterium]